MFLKKIICSCLVLFCCDLQCSLTNRKTESELPLPSLSSSLIMSPNSDFVGSSGYQAGSSERFAEERSGNLELEALKGQVEELNRALKDSKKENAKLKDYLRTAYTNHLELNATLNDANKCNTSILIGATAFVSSACCIVFCLSPLCDDKIIKIDKSK